MIASAWKSVAGMLMTFSCMATFAVHAATPLGTAPAANARVVRLVYANNAQMRGQMIATAIAPAGGKHVDVYLAERDGTPFHQIGRIDDTAFAKGACCGTLYELPQQVGSLQKGTLLWAASFGQNVKPERRMAIRIYRSNNEGRTWQYLSEVVSPNTGGIWEPEFTVDRAGALVLFYSDETDQAQYSQAIRKTRSGDGVTWRDAGYVVASNIQADRPGMPVTRRLASGQWMMTYELGGPAHFIAYYRLSDDGWNWGDPANMGAEIRLPNGSFPAHTPRFTVMPDGAIVLAGQLIETPALKRGARNGRVLLLNRAGNPATPWQTIPAPVPVPGACSETCPKQQWCPNYSPSLLPSANGEEVLEFASEWKDNGCYTSYAWGAWRSSAVQAAGQ